MSEVVVNITENPSFVDVTINETVIDVTVTVIEGNVTPSVQRNLVSVFTADDMPSNPVSNVVYFLEGIVDLGAKQITVPSTGLYISGYNFDVSQLVSTANSYTMFVGATAGNVLFTDIALSTSGTSSKVFDLTAATGDEAIELNRVNFNDCTSRGELTNFRQGLGNGNGYFGGTPELTLRGTWNGWRETTSIARGMSNFTSFWKEGPGLTFSGRFITDANVDLPALGAFFDFAPANFVNDEVFQLKGVTVTRQGVINSKDVTIYPNIDETSVKSLWKGNVGIPNTTKYIKGNISVEIPTPIPATLLYYAMLGTFTIERNSHFDSPANGQLRLLSGNGTYLFQGDIEVQGSAGNTIAIRAVKSTDGGLTFTDEINHVSRVINNLAGSNDVAFVPVNFIGDLSAGDIVRLELENYTATGNLTAKLDSFFIITEV